METISILACGKQRCIYRIRLRLRSILDDMEALYEDIELLLLLLEQFLLFIELGILHLEVSVPASDSHAFKSDRVFQRLDLLIKLVVIDLQPLPLSVKLIGLLVQLLLKLSLVLAINILHGFLVFVHRTFQRRLMRRCHDSYSIDILRPVLVQSFSMRLAFRFQSCFLLFLHHCLHLRVMFGTELLDLGFVLFS